MELVDMAEDQTVSVISPFDTLPDAVIDGTCGLFPLLVQYSALSTSRYRVSSFGPRAFFPLLSITGEADTCVNATRAIRGSDHSR